VDCKYTFLHLCISLSISVISATTMREYDVLIPITNSVSTT
jgi:hypothetical protein